MDSNPAGVLPGFWAKSFGCVSFELKNELKAKDFSGKVSLDKQL